MDRELGFYLKGEVLDHRRFAIAEYLREHHIPHACISRYWFHDPHPRF